MFGKLDTPEKVFSHELGAALTMERDTLAMLEDLQQAAQREEVKELLREHAAETRVQIEVVEQCFGLLGEEVDDSPCPVTKALAAEARAKLKAVDDSLADAVVLAGALQTEHHEQAVYENLVVHARARGAERVATLLESSLAVEQQAGSRVLELIRRIATTGVATEHHGRSAGATAGIVAGVAATIGAAAVAATRASHHEGGEHAATTTTTTTAPVTTTTAPVTTTTTGGTTGATTTGATTTAGTGATAGTGEELNDHALLERIEVSEHPEHDTTGR
ncbi:DUF892 family protein [Kineococcus gypseus]|uniref:DUF892 family protein n=1 Tax=Kineococcus gypseus TaxID=1637102 RepID=UPI003D7DB1EB